MSNIPTTFGGAFLGSMGVFALDPTVLNAPQGAGALGGGAIIGILLWALQAQLKERLADAQEYQGQVSRINQEHSATVQRLYDERQALIVQIQSEGTRQWSEVSKLTDRLLASQAALADKLLAVAPGKKES